jgi:light-regulated signal transduction histidine kinase (bacteriophytochrome)
MSMADEDVEMNTGNTVKQDKFRQQYSAFIEMAAHDLQSPLRKLGVLTDRLTATCKEKAGDEVNEYTQRIHACLSEMKSLVEGFTELAAAIPETLHYEVCDLEKIVKQLLQEFSAQVKEKKATVQFETLPITRADKIQMQLLFKKLLENMFLFSKKDVPMEISIQSEGLTDPEKKQLQLPEYKSYFKIELTDNGMGFDADDAERIFQPLVRLHGKSSFPGNGLGLALVKKIAENHKGLVYAEGSPGNGARFILIIPENP